jgi:hypothetical protein
MGVMSDVLARAESRGDGVADALAEAAESWADAELSRFEQPPSTRSAAESVVSEANVALVVVSDIWCMVKLLCSWIGEASMARTRSLSSTNTCIHTAPMEFCCMFAAGSLGRAADPGGL